MPRYFEVERVTTSSRRFLVDMGHDDATQESAENRVRGGIANRVKDLDGVEQILYINNNAVQTITTSNCREDILPGTFVSDENESEE